MTCIRPEQSRHGGRWGQATVTSRAEASDMFWQKDGEVAGITSEHERPVPSRPNSWVTLGLERLGGATGQPERRKPPRRPSATDYAAASATGPGERLGDAGDTVWLNESTLVAWESGLAPHEAASGFYFCASTPTAET
jgi:hypothetical protein